MQKQPVTVQIMKYLLHATLDEQDEETLRLEEKLPLSSGTRVKVIVEPEEEKAEKVEPYSWMRTALEAGLEGPSDASIRVNDPPLGTEEVV